MDTTIFFLLIGISEFFSNRAERYSSLSQWTKKKPAIITRRKSPIFGADLAVLNRLLVTKKHEPGKTFKFKANKGSQEKELKKEPRAEPETTNKAKILKEKKSKSSKKLGQRGKNQSSHTSVSASGIHTRTKTILHHRKSSATFDNTDRVVDINGSLLRKAFADMTQRFLQPLLPYIYPPALNSKKGATKWNPYNPPVCDTQPTLLFSYLMCTFSQFR